MTQTTFDQPCISTDGQLLKSLEVDSFLNTGDNSSVLSILSSKMECHFQVLIRSFLLCSARQEWNSNSPYMRNKRITPGIVFLWSTVSRMVFQMTSNSYQILYVSMLWRRIVSFLISFYAELTPSRARLQQLKFDLSFTSISSLHLISLLLSFDSKDFDLDVVSKISTQLLEIVECCQIIIYLLAVLDEQVPSKVLSLYLKLEGLPESSAAITSLAEMKKLCHNLCESWEIAKLANLPTSITKENLVFGSFYFGIEENPIRRNELLTRRITLIEKLELANFPHLHSLFGLPSRTSFVKLLHSSLDFGWFWRIVRKRKEMIEGTFPPLTDQDIEVRGTLKTTFEKYTKINDLV